MTNIILKKIRAATDAIMLGGTGYVWFGGVSFLSEKCVFNMILRVILGDHPARGQVGWEPNHRLLGCMRRF